MFQTEKRLPASERTWTNDCDQRKVHDTWSIGPFAHASCTMTQLPSFANCVTMVAATCRIIVACELHRSVRRILRRILWRIFSRISRRILRRIFLAYPHSDLEQAGVANFPLKPTPGTNPWNERLAECLEWRFRGQQLDLRSGCADFLHKSQTRCKILGQLVPSVCLPHPTLCQSSVL